MPLPPGEANREPAAPVAGTVETWREFLEVSTTLWDVNQAAIIMAAEKACAVCEIPHELLSSPTAARFLAKLQRLTFTVGVAAVLSQSVPANGADPHPTRLRRQNKSE